MPDHTREVSPGPRPRTARTQDGAVLVVPSHWELVPPGDPALTRRLKKAGFTWTVKERRGKRMMSRGVWGDSQTAKNIREVLLRERADPAYQRKLNAAKVRRDEAQLDYASEFQKAVELYLAFTSPYVELGRQVSEAITAQTIQVGSGTVARTKRIPLEQKVKAATTAWLRHQTTGYDDMSIPRGKGARREVRRLLAGRSRQLLGRYRRGEAIDAALCPLQKAIKGDKRR
ncbi:MAG: DUF2293 domain-containing protein [Deltaproteobacteria bacterium]|nr:DUF2293 domain-containing protein [Deltaproteobacteria bacterium]